ncbi:MAG: DUF3147 family protein [Thiovulaceae bacterium]|nr:DUF3147 family protein [Sulfurimonadaceae bacterium]
MSWLIFKYLTTAALVVIISEFAKRSDKLGGLVAALPIMTFLTLIWLYVEKQPDSKIINHAWYTFWYVLPTLPMFFAFPFIYQKIGFWPTMGVSVIITLISFVLLSIIAKSFGVELW